MIAKKRTVLQLLKVCLPSLRLHIFHTHSQSSETKGMNHIQIIFPKPRLFVQEHREPLKTRKFAPALLSLPLTSDFTAETQKEITNPPSGIDLGAAWLDGPKALLSLWNLESKRKRPYFSSSSKRSMCFIKAICKDGKPQ